MLLTITNTVDMLFSGINIGCRIVNVTKWMNIQTKTTCEQELLLALARLISISSDFSLGKAAFFSVLGKHYPGCEERGLIICVLLYRL